MARRRKKSRRSIFQRVLRTLLLNAAITIAAILTCFALVKHWVIPAVNDSALSIATSQQQAIGKIQQDYQKTLQQQRHMQERQQQARQAAQLQKNQEEQRLAWERERLAAYLAEQEHKRIERKKQAWQRFYQRSPACQRDPTTVACANAHIAAMRQFEREYQDME